jgi:hypothetical protein
VQGGLVVRFVRKEGTERGEVIGVCEGNGEQKEE